MSQTQSPSISKKKVSNEQLNLLVDFISANRILLHGKTKPLEANSGVIENLWDEITNILNSCGSGPAKTKSQWKKTFIDWKCHTKKKARDIVVSCNRTGGGEGDSKKLTPVEEKLMATIKWLTVKGNESAPELGLATDTDDDEMSEGNVKENCADTIFQQAAEMSSKKRSYLAADSAENSAKRPRTESLKKTATLQQVVETYAAAQRANRETAEIVSGQSVPIDLKKRELDLRGIELKIRLMEAKNTQKELELRERELVLKERDAEAKIAQEHYI